MPVFCYQTVGLVIFHIFTIFLQFYSSMETKNASSWEYFSFSPWSISLLFMRRHSETIYLSRGDGIDEHLFAILQCPLHLSISSTFAMQDFSFMCILINGGKYFVQFSTKMLSSYFEIIGKHKCNCSAAVEWIVHKRKHVQKKLHKKRRRKKPNN